MDLGAFATILDFCIIVRPQQGLCPSMTFLNPVPIFLLNCIERCPMWMWCMPVFTPLGQNSAPGLLMALEDLGGAGQFNPWRLWFQGWRCNCAIPTGYRCAANPHTWYSLTHLQGRVSASSPGGLSAQALCASWRWIGPSLAGEGDIDVGRHNHRENPSKAHAFVSS